MARTRRALQLDDLTEGDLVEFDRGGGHKSSGTYLGVERNEDAGFWTIKMRDTAGMTFAFWSRSARSVRILKPVARSEPCE